MFGFTCMPLCKFFVATFRTVDRGCPAGTRSSLRPLSIEGRTTGKARANEPRGCGSVSASEMRIEERRCPPHTPSLRAQRSNPEMYPRRDSGLLRCARNDAVETVVCLKLRSRARDAARRLLDDALQSRGPCHSEPRGVLGPGSAPHRLRAAPRPGQEETERRCEPRPRPICLTSRCRTRSAIGPPEAVRWRRGRSPPSPSGDGCSGACHASGRRSTPASRC
ncbi:hypothetical protein ABIA06_001910 [Bradyrhizobium yuanmingense]